MNVRTGTSALGGCPGHSYFSREHCSLVSVPFRAQNPPKKALAMEFQLEGFVGAGRTVGMRGDPETLKEQGLGARGEA